MIGGGIAGILALQMAGAFDSYKQEAKNGEKNIGKKSNNIAKNATVVGIRSINEGR